MGLFGSSSPFDTDIEKATNENNTTDQWGLIMEICDRVGGSAANAKECLRSVMRRLGHTDPHVVIQAITLLDACVSNCGKTFHLEVASREFENEFRRLMTKHQPTVQQKMAGLIKKWAENDFKGDSQLNLIPSLYAKMKSEGVDFPDAEAKSATAAAPKPSKDPNVVSSQQEMEDIAKAIELSLKESPMKHATSARANAPAATVNAPSSSSLYPTTSISFSSSTSTGGGGGGGASVSGGGVASTEARKVLALYDFEAAEDNELNFMAGDIIHVTDDSDPNWWKGYNQRGEGLFPASFVTADLSVEPESMRLDLNKQTSKKFVQFADDVKEEVVEINEPKLDRLLHLLHEANPEDPSTDTAEMLSLENMVNQMGPLIDAELERVDRTHAQLARLSVGLVDAFNLYHQLMRESEKPHYMGGYPSNNHPQAMYGPPQGPHGMPTGGFPQHHQPGSVPPMMMNHANMFPQQQQHQTGMPFMPGMPPNGQFPVSVSSGPASMPMPMMGPNTSPQQQMMPQQPQRQLQMQHPQMNNHQGVVSNISNMGVETAQQHQHPQQQVQQNSTQNGVQAAPNMNNPNTVTSNSVPITHPGQPPSFGPPQTGVAMNYPQQGVGNPQQQIHSMPQQQFHPVHQGPQFQPNPTNGTSPHHAPPVQQQQQHNQGGLGQMMPLHGMMPQVTSQAGHFNPMTMGGGQQMPMGDNMNIPIYQQQR